MSSDKLLLKAESRTVTGKKVATLKRVGKIPGVINERGKDSVNVMTELNPLTKMWHQAGGNHVLALDVDGKPTTVMFKHVTLDPAKGIINHVVFQAIKQNETVEAEIPVVITGEIPAERVGLFLVHPLDTVLVKALPADLPNNFELSGEGLVQAGDMLKVEDIKVTANVEILTEPDRPIAIVEEPRAAVEEEVVEEDEESAGDVPSEHGSESTDAKSE